jgi:curved DNA-binding protein CbpA
MLGDVSAAENLYEALQVSPNAEREVIEAAYHRLARKYHPDVSRQGDSGARMKQLVHAYAILSDPKRRAEYDAVFRAPADQARESAAAEQRPHGSDNVARWAIAIAAALVVMVLVLTPARVLIVRGLPVVLLATLVVGVVCVVWFLWRRADGPAVK